VLPVWSSLRAPCRQKRRDDPPPPTAEGNNDGGRAAGWPSAPGALHQRLQVTTATSLFTMSETSLCHGWGCGIRTASVEQLDQSRKRDHDLPPRRCSRPSISFKTFRICSCVVLFLLILHPSSERGRILRKRSGQIVGNLSVLFLLILRPSSEEDESYGKEVVRLWGTCQTPSILKSRTAQDG
jgi:hypothetical protein